ncbi:MAG: hypothetical protein MUF87_14900 [Anaerolineae bacterium]|nr:hypothetical protein [Anaerolineae bacterium]
MVDYYGRLITMEQLEQEGLELTCAPIRVSTLESWYRYWTYQPEWMCFDTDYELDHWMRSQGLLD